MESATGDSDLVLDLRKTIAIHHYQGQFLRLVLTGVLTLVAHRVPFFSVPLEDSGSVFAVQSTVLTNTVYYECQ